MFRPLVLLLALVPSIAHADILPPGEKGVKLSIRIDGEVPAGKALVLAHTFRGADVVPLGTVAPVEWHPLGGPMKLVLVDAAEAAKVEAARKDMNRAATDAIADKGMACSGPIEGVRTMPESSPADEVRWTYSVKVSAGACVGQLVRTELLSKDGKVVETREADGGAPSPPASGAVPASTASSPATATKSPAAPPAAPPVAAAGTCGACAVGGTSDPTGALVAALGVLAFASRRRRR